MDVPKETFSHLFQQRVVTKERVDKEVRFSQRRGECLFCPLEIIFYTVCIERYLWIVLCWEVCLIATYKKLTYNEIGKGIIDHFGALKNR